MYASLSFILLLLLFSTHATDCPPGSGGVDCLPCGVGKYKSTEGLQDCLVCPKGTVSLNTTSTSIDNCEYCQVNTYEQAWTDCVECPLHTISPLGSTTLTDCVAQPGYYGMPGHEGTICPAGSFCSTGIMRPTPCPEHLFSSEGAGACQDGKTFQLGVWEWISLSSWGVIGFIGILCILWFRKSWFVMPVGTPYIALQPPSQPALPRIHVRIQL
jgi:hypothetical protein